MRELVFNEQNICLAEKRNLIDGIVISRWCFQDGLVEYKNNIDDTISLSLTGGTRASRFDKQVNHGGLNSLCIMPKETSSQWLIDDFIKFAHVYINRGVLTEFASINTERDIRGLDLEDATYFQDPILAKLIRQCLNPNISLLGYEQLTYCILNQLVSIYSFNRNSRQFHVGGLSPMQRRKVIDFIEDNIASKITIKSLAAEVNLSPFHFAREFKSCFGLPPAQFIMKKRLLLAKSFLNSDAQISEISLRCGFNSHSHLSMCFKKTYHVTPLLYRGLMQSEEVSGQLCCGFL